MTLLRRMIQSSAVFHFIDKDFFICFVVEMETALIDWNKICDSEEDPNRTVVLIAPYGTFVHYVSRTCSRD